jgi:hypothetical protein
MSKLTIEQKTEIEKISKEFADGFKPEIKEIAGSGWLIVDPLSGYLEFLGYANIVTQIPPKKGSPQVLIIQFIDGTMFIPAGSDLPVSGAKDWMWIDSENNQTPTPTASEERVFITLKNLDSVIDYLTRLRKNGEEAAYLVVINDLVELLKNTQQSLNSTASEGEKTLGEIGGELAREFLKTDEAKEIAKKVMEEDYDKAPCYYCQGGGCPDCGGYGWIPTEHKHPEQKQHDKHCTCENCITAPEQKQDTKAIIPAFPHLVERFADNSEHSHWELICKNTGATLWSSAEQNQEDDDDIYDAVRKTRNHPDKHKEQKQEAEVDYEDIANKYAIKLYPKQRKYRPYAALLINKAIQEAVRRREDCNLK